MRGWVGEKGREGGRVSRQEGVKRERERCKERQRVVPPWKKKKKHILSPAANTKRTLLPHCRAQDNTHTHK